MGSAMNDAFGRTRLSTHIVPAQLYVGKGPCHPSKLSVPPSVQAEAGGKCSAGNRVGGR